MSGVLSGLLLAFEIMLGALVAYLLLLTALAWLAPRKRALPGSPLTRFAVLIPAHNEELLLPDLLTSLDACEYDPQRCAVHVVADNCIDRTAELARAHGPAVAVHERFNDQLVGKGYALQWLIERVADSTRYDAYVILDADSVVASPFLREMDAVLRAGADAVQGYYTVRDDQDTWASRLRVASLALLHYVRPLGRKALGLSPGLKGNGMAFTGDILSQFPWSAALTEDMEYHLNLILAGKRVVFAPEALVLAEMPGTLRGSRTQHVRWERGKIEMMRLYVPRLLRAGWQQRRWQPIDAALEQVIPPFSVFVGLILLALLGGVLLGSSPAIWLGLALLAGVLVYILGGQAIAKSPAMVYAALLGSPLYMAWKVWLYARVLLGLDKQGWVRTRREGE